MPWVDGKYVMGGGIGGPSCDTKPAEVRAEPPLRAPTGRAPIVERTSTAEQTMDGLCTAIWKPCQALQGPYATKKMVVNMGHFAPRVAPKIANRKFPV